MPRRVIAAVALALVALAQVRAADPAHSLDAELAEVRALMQSGEYRHALALLAHTVGEHRETSEPAALYAWILAAGGQAAYARRLLDHALSEAPGDTLLLATCNALQRVAPAAPFTLLRPLPSGVALPTAAHVVASGVLLPSGRHAIVPATALPRLNTGKASLWVRNGLGQTVAAVPVRAGDDVTLLALVEPLAADADALPAVRDPFAGSPGFVVGYAASADAAPAWPWLSAGFLGGAAAREGPLRRLGIDAPALFGAPVFDASGRLAGMLVPSRSSGVGSDAVWLPVTALAALLGEDAAPSAGVAAARPAVDRVYERALRTALQVIAED